MASLYERISDDSKAGLPHWMHRVLEGYGRVSKDLEPKPVHDLRVALRRCRSLADGMQTIDMLGGWKPMRKASKRLLEGLGELRDVQVAQRWVRKLCSSGDAVAALLGDAMRKREGLAREQAWVALREFDRKQWKLWAKQLPPRESRISLDSPVFELLALERWMEAYELHRRALHSRRRVAFHRLRIGLKRFRYTVENFLPQRHEQWGRELKQLQDWLGEMHDLDVVWTMVLRLGVGVPVQERLRWRVRLEQERQRRISRYRRKMVGRKALWWKWRAELPQGPQLEAAGKGRVAAWASFLDPDFAHSQRVAQLALQIYDGLAANGLAATRSDPRNRAILEVAALMHDVGRALGDKKHPRASYRMIRKLPPPPGWTSDELEVVAWVARYHTNGWSHLRHKGFAALPAPQQQKILFLAGILRLANTFDTGHAGGIERLAVFDQSGALVISARGYAEEEPLASKLASARHMLEVACHRPILISPDRTA